MFNRKTVDGILASFNKTISDLNAVADQEINLWAVKGSESARLLKEAEVHRDESIRAGKIAEKIKALVA
jgi:hypothetical protein